MGVTRISKGRVAIGAVDADGLSVRSLRVKLVPTTSNAQVATGKKVPPGSAILNAYIKTSGASAATVGASSMTVGLSSATTALLNGVNIATAGIKVGSLASTAGTVTLGASLQETTSAGPVQKPAIVDSETEVVYATAAPSPNLNGELIIEYRKLG
jgi:hypothetical protein